MLYEEVPDEIGAAVDRALWFYRCGREENSEAADAADTAPSAGPRIYSFEEDAPYIYAAFLSQYGLDLTEIPFLHWWKFKALFGALEERHEFVKIMRYRSVEMCIRDRKRTVRKAKRPGQWGRRLKTHSH